MRDRLGFSALHFAANQTVGLVADLLRARCDVNAANLQQMTPLHSAAGMGRVDICEVLLDAGASSGAGATSTPVRTPNLPRLTAALPQGEQMLAISMKKM